MLVPWEIWRDNFIQDASESVARSYWEQLSPEPNQVHWDKLGLKRFYSLTIPKSFIHCRHDKALPPGYFYPRMSSRLGAFKLVEMDGSHEVKKSSVPSVPPSKPKYSQYHGLIASTLALLLSFGLAHPSDPTRKIAEAGLFPHCVGPLGS